ncbi:MAG: TetR family transcriptional regulator [Streptosporangiales bacterium]|nr:TetR family transcriptional regulator [Streptosporangiales bacterium]
MSPRRAAALRDDDSPSLREHLIASTERIIASHGTAGLTVRAIAREAGVADGVLYNHFTDREELIATALRTHVRTVEESLAPLPDPGAGTVEANLRAYLAYGLTMHRAILPAFAGLLNRPTVLTRFAELDEHGEQWRDRLTDYLRAERALGRLDPDAHVDTAAAMLVGICHDTVLAGLLQPDTSPTEPAIEPVVATLLTGIGR